jgi:hypothetical protein
MTQQAPTGGAPSPEWPEAPSPASHVPYRNEAGDDPTTRSLVSRLGRTVIRSARLRADLRSIARYGRRAPLMYQRVWFRPRDCQQRTPGGSLASHTWAGHVLDGDWDLETVPFSEHPVARFCHLRWVEGVPWEDTGVYTWLMGRIEREGGVIDGCRTLDDVVARYEALDRIYEQVRREGRIRPQSAVPGRNERERGGIRICIGRYGQPIFNWAGHHRLAMARILDLDEVPGQLQVVHPAALPIWQRLYIRSRLARAALAQPGM